MALSVGPSNHLAGAHPGHPALVKALARAHWWKRLLEEGRYGSLAELAKAERIDRSYLGKMLRLTLLVPDIVEAILDAREPVAVSGSKLVLPRHEEVVALRRRA